MFYLNEAKNLATGIVFIMSISSLAHAQWPFPPAEQPNEEVQGSIGAAPGFGVPPVGIPQVGFPQWPVSPQGPGPVGPVGGWPGSGNQGGWPGGGQNHGPGGPGHGGPGGWPGQIDQIDKYKAEQMAEEFYNGILMRRSDPEGLNHQAIVIRRDGIYGAVTVARNIAESPEFRQNILPRFSPEQIVFRMYRALLQRKPDPSGMYTWSNLIRQGRAGEAAAGIVNSEEYRQKHSLR